MFVESVVDLVQAKRKPTKKELFYNYNYNYYTWNVNFSFWWSVDSISAYKLSIVFIKFNYLKKQSTNKGVSGPDDTKTIKPS